MGTSTSGASSDALPGVSYVMPVLNDVTHVRAAVASLLNQDYPGPFDVSIAVGPSIDGTNELVDELSRADSRIHVLENPVGSTPSGLNIAITASAYPIVVRVDAHSVLPPDYTRIAVETIQRTGAGNVGGIMDAKGTTPFEDAVAAAYGSRVGLGGTPHHVGGKEGRADTVYLGVFRRDVLERVGMFDERIKRGQDWELNRRIRSSGSGVWFTPELRVVYRPRPSLSRLARQFFSTGMWRGELSRRFPSPNTLRYFAPPVMVLAVTVGLLLGLVGLVQLAIGTPAFALWGFAIPALYALIVIVAAFALRGDLSPRARCWLLVVLPCIHFCWGIGFIPGFLLLASNIAAQKYEKGSGSSVHPAP
ncbi:Glycosyltransferase, catalytic subunit of cellulose synthase and poly-beta-1,6-N-acetylglucosamine synthase [Paramicrobacterium humi]|uniref:Glycosyltransferase, catalytic subunit of cellulose synthase and poly-beta-1,6-N-acetylglucosamine synthase n=1 Tax=Paramicrobacterium humi TaxID=640635 RepID=A0A1H4TBA9_9MICO|nr:glycosyltransferase family 2 protein [Microbacterium humi]SEC53424.1 Glycosyltransferase, catalytic subunit of cellulose synthase and poly-beta-1,6-N-acetylglucosamine synthase [Microbacterium humi]